MTCNKIKIKNLLWFDLNKYTVVRHCTAEIFHSRFFFFFWQGLEPVAFSLMDRCTSVSLVSEGAEAVLISRKFFMQHLTEEKIKQLRTTVGLQNCHLRLACSVGFSPFSAGTDIRRQNLTSNDVRLWRLKSIPALGKNYKFILSVDPEHKYSNKELTEAFRMTSNWKTILSPWFLKYFRVVRI